MYTLDTLQFYVTVKEALQYHKLVNKMLAAESKLEMLKIDLSIASAPAKKKALRLKIKAAKKLMVQAQVAIDMRLRGLDAEYKNKIDQDQQLRTKPFFE
jgi:hypothetical protein